MQIWRQSSFSQIYLEWIDSMKCVYRKRGHVHEPSYHACILCVFFFSFTLAQFPLADLIISICTRFVCDLDFVSLPSLKSAHVNLFKPQIMAKCMSICRTNDTCFTYELLSASSKYHVRCYSLHWIGFIHSFIWLAYKQVFFAAASL